jgi:hypothetical protein
MIPSKKCRPNTGYCADDTLEEEKTKAKGQKNK